MDFKQVVLRKREDVGKVFLLFPHTGVMMETESKDLNNLYDLLQLMKSKPVDEVEQAGRNKGIPEETLRVLQVIHNDLKEMDVSFGWEQGSEPKGLPARG